jgi:hypothetical protein
MEEEDLENETVLPSEIYFANEKKMKKKKWEEPTSIFYFKEHNHLMWHK